MGIKTNSANVTELHTTKAGQIVTSIDNVAGRPKFDGYTTGDIQATCTTITSPSGGIANWGTNGVAIGGDRIFVGSATEQTSGRVTMLDFNGEEVGVLTPPEFNAYGNALAWGGSPRCRDGFLVVSSGTFDNDPNAVNAGDRTGRSYVLDQRGNLLNTLAIPSNLYDDTAYYPRHAIGEGRILVTRQLARDNYASNPAVAQSGNATLYDYNGNILVSNMVLHNKLEYYDSSGATISRSTGIDYEGVGNTGYFGAGCAIGGGKILIGSPQQAIYHHPDFTTGTMPGHGVVYMFDLDGNFEKCIYPPVGFQDSIDGADFGYQISIGCDRILITARYAENNNDYNIGKVYVYDMDGNYLFALSSNNAPTSGNGAPIDEIYGAQVYGGIIAIATADELNPASPTGTPYGVIELYDTNGNYIDRVLHEDSGGNIIQGSATTPRPFVLGYGMLLSVIGRTTPTGADTGAINMYKLPTCYDGLIQKAAGITMS